MSWNNGYEVKQFKKENKQRKRKCQKLNMPYEQIRTYCESYRREFLDDRKVAEHTQSLNVLSEGMEEEGRSPLLKRYLEAISVEMEPDYSNPFWWFDTLENEKLIEAIRALSEKEKLLLTFLDIDEDNLEDVKESFGFSSVSGVYYWKERLHAKIRDLMEGSYEEHA